MRKKKMDIRGRFATEQKRKTVWVVKALFTAAAFMLFYGAVASLFFGICIFLFVFLLYRQNVCRSTDIFCHVTAALLALFWMAARVPLHHFLGYAVMLAGFYFLWDELLARLYSFFDRRSILASPETGKRSRPALFFAALVILSLFIWLPYFLAFYPGILTNDSLNQLYQAVGLSDYNNNHPWIHTMLIHLCYRLGMALFGSEQKAVALYTLIQMVFLACVYCYSLLVFYRECVSRWILLLLFCFYTLLPVNALPVVYMDKNGYFSAFVLLYIVLVWKMARHHSQGQAVRWYDWLGFVIVGFLVSIFRSNGYYAFLLSIPFTLYFFRKVWKKAGACLLAVVACVMLYKGPVLRSFGVEGTDFIESLSIPLQQVARVVTVKGTDALSKDEYDLLDTILNVDSVGEIYFERISDPIKNAIRAKGNKEYLRANMEKYTRLYLSLGFRNFPVYLDAYILQTQGFYAPEITYWVSFYPYAEECRELGIYSHPLVPEGIRQKLINVSSDYPAIPLYRQLWYISPYVWILMIGFGYALHRRADWLPFLMPVAIWGTLLLATPVYAGFRYAYPILISAPFLLCAAQISRGDSRQIWRDGEKKCGKNSEQDEGTGDYSRLQ